MKKVSLLLLGVLVPAVALAQSAAGGELKSGANDSVAKPKMDHGAHLGVPDDPEERAAEQAMYSRMGVQQDVWFQDGDYPAIIASLKFEVKEWPQDYESVTSLGWMLGNIEHWNEELGVYIDYRDSFPDNPEAAFPLGFFYYMKKSYVLSVNALAPSINLATKPHPDTYRLLAHGYERVGLWNKSVAVWDVYLAMHPDDLVGVANRKKALSHLNSKSL